MSPIRRSTISTRSSTGNNPFRNRISANPRKRGFRGFFMQAGKESWRRLKGSAATEEGPGRRRKKGRDGGGRTGAATEESPAVMTERPRREKWRKTATTKGRTVTEERPGGDDRRTGTAAEGPGRRRKDRGGDGRKPGDDDRRTGTAEGGDFPTFFRRKRKNTRIFAALDP